jgi:predicted nucleotidyltransferase
MAFDTSVLDQALKDRRTRWEQQRQAVLTHLMRWLDDHGRSFGLKQLYVFGSLAQPGRFHDGSDVDVAVLELPDEQFFKFMAALSVELGFDVDLIELDKCHFAGKIRQEGILWTPSNERF